MKSPRALAPALFLMVALIAGCGRSKTETAAAPEPPLPATAPAPPVAEAVATLGKAIDERNAVVMPAERFFPDDTVYVSVSTAQTPAGSSLRARWLDPEGTLINEASQTVAAGAAAATEFHIANPEGWVAGEYKVELSLNGQPLTTRTFVVVAGA